MMKRITAALAAIALVTVALWWIFRLPAATDPVVAVRRAAAPTPVPADRSADDQRTEALRAALRNPPDDRDGAVGSLRDTQVDGALAVDDSGRLLINPDLRRFFEYFFIATGEESEEAIRGRITAALDIVLDGDAARDAHSLLGRYLQYRARGEAVAAASANEPLEDRVEALRQLRVEVFGPDDAAALFADEEALHAAALAARRIRDAELTDAERERQLAELEAQLPADVRAARQAATAPLRLAEEEAALRAAGGSPQEIQALREQAVGADAAERLAALDQQRATWRSRVNTYRAARAAIDADPALDPTQRDAAIAALRARQFSGPELLRIEALDRMATGEAEVHGEP